MLVTILLFMFSFNLSAMKYSSDHIMDCSSGEEVLPAKNLKTSDLEHFYFLGESLYRQGTKESHEKAISYFRLAADLGLAKAQDKMCVLTYHEEIAAPEKTAAYYCHLAAEHGLAKSQFYLGSMYYSGEGIERNLELAAHYFLRAADQGMAEAQNSLGNLYFWGEGVQKNRKRSFHYYLLAANQGLPKAQLNVGNMLSPDYVENVEGIEQDYQQADKFYQAAADQGLAEAQYQLAELSYFGLGVPSNLEKAFHYYSLAAEQQHPYALIGLGWMYCKGYFAKQDLVKGLKYLELANQLGAKGSRKFIKQMFCGNSP